MKDELPVGWSSEKVRIGLPFKVKVERLTLTPTEVNSFFLLTQQLQSAYEICSEISEEYFLCTFLLRKVPNSLIQQLSFLTLFLWKSCLQ